MRSVYLRGVDAPRNPRIFRKRVKPPGMMIGPGEVVAVRMSDERFVGRGFYSPRSVIGVRILDREEDGPPIDAAWFRLRIEAAAAKRDVLRDVTNSWRVVHAEGDGLSGLVIDRYDDIFVVEVGARGMFEHLDAIEDALDGRVVVRAAERVQAIEGFSVRDPRSAPARAVVVEHGISFDVDCRGGHKTGFFLDQRDARAEVALLADGRSVLDLCCYTGGFALNAARGGARSVVGIDLDERAVALARENAARNGLDVVFEHADAFDALRGGAGAELVVLDPPKFARTRKDLPAARRRSTDLNAAAFGAVAPGGLLYTFSCTGLFSPDDFMRQVLEGARRAGRKIDVVKETGQPLDHPVAEDCPETRYLAGVLAEVA